MRLNPEGQPISEGLRPRNPSEILDLYRIFLASIPLDKYREELKDIKRVEQDLPDKLLPLRSIFANYWESQRFPDFESWFEEFWAGLRSKPESAKVLKQFMKHFFDKDDDGWFRLGFRARMYRTWLSVLTQLDFCYGLLHIAHKEGKSLNLEANAELDRKGVDLRVGQINFQIQKISQRKEARPGIAKKEKVIIPYVVYDLDEYGRLSCSPRVSEASKKKYQKSLRAFHRYFLCLQNGFVVFGDEYLRLVLQNLHDFARLKQAIDELLEEVSGE